MTIPCNYTHLVMDNKQDVHAVCKSEEEARQAINKAFKSGKLEAIDWMVLPFQVRPAEWTPDQIIPREELLRNQEQAALWRSLVAGLHRHGYDQVMDKGVNGIVKLIEAAARTVTGQGKVAGDNPLKRSTDIEALRDKFAAEAPIDFTIARNVLGFDTAAMNSDAAMFRFMSEWARLRFEWADRMIAARAQEAA
jgi:hypothetical protein